MNLNLNCGIYLISLKFYFGKQTNLFLHCRTTDKYVYELRKILIQLRYFLTVNIDF